jgi:hypothetical protein
MGLLGSIKRLRISRQPIAPERIELLRSMPRGSVCAEIGVYRGQFSKAILEIVKPSRLHLIDPWVYRPSYTGSWFGGDIGGSQAVMDSIYRVVVERFAREIRQGQVIIHRGFSAEIAKEFPDDYFDWIYVDADHKYKAVKSDLNAFYSKVKATGLIAGDNYGDNPHWWWKDGVKRAVDEFTCEDWATIQMIANDQFILRKTAAAMKVG